VFHVKYIDIYGGLYNTGDIDIGQTEKVDLDGNNETFAPLAVSIGSDVYYKNERGTQNDSSFTYYTFDQISDIRKIDDTGTTRQILTEDFIDGDITATNPAEVSVSMSSKVPWNDESEYFYYNDFRDGIIYKLNSDLEKILSFSDSSLNNVRFIEAGFSDVVYCIASNNQDILAVSLAEQKILWTATSVFGGDNVDSMALDFPAKGLYIGSENGDVQKIDTSDGSLIWPSNISTNSNNLSVNNLVCDRADNVYGTVDVDTGGSGKTDTFKISNFSIDWKASGQGITQHTEKIQGLTVDWYFNVYTGDKDAKLRKITQ
jgi:hypothetical protein